MEYRSHYIKAILSLIFVAGAIVNVSAQITAENPIVRRSLNEMFDNLDKTKVPTGYLLDYAIDLIELGLYDGTSLSDSNYVTVPVFEDLLTSIKSASVGTCHIEDVPQIMTGFKSQPEEDVVNIAYMLYRYNYIREDALQNNLLNYSSGKVSDKYIDEIWQNPYGEAFVFGFTPSTNVSTDGSVCFKFSSGYSFFNALGLNMKFDAGDGNGYRNVNLSSIIQVDYSTPGLKELKFSISPYWGITLETHSYIYIESISSNGPTKRAAIPSIPPEEESVFYGKELKAHIATFYRNGHSRLTRPFIVVEGFDPWELLKAFGYSNKEGLDDHFGATNYSSFYNSYWTLKDEYDLIYIDWYNSTEDLRDNAGLLIEIIKNINLKKAADECTERSVIMGQSMGGLIARIAMLMMEDMDIPHGISTYISHDTPHLGANVPLGALYFLHHALCFICGYDTIVNLTDALTELDIKDKKKVLWNTLHSQAVKQMLVNYIDEDGRLNNDVHEDWQELLRDIGFPCGDPGHPLEKLSIVNGYNNSQSDIFSGMHGQHYLWIDGYFKSTFLTDILAPMLGVGTGLYFLPLILGSPSLMIAMLYPGTNKFNIHAEVNPYMNHRALLSSLQISYTKKFFWRQEQTYYLFNESSVAPSMGLLYDKYPGSIYETPYDSEVQSLTPNGVFHNTNITFGVTERIMFIPTASSLSLFNQSDFAYLKNYYTNRPIPGVDCPFDAYALTDTPQEHTYIDNLTFQWIAQQTNMKIEGPTYVSTNANFSTTGYTGPLNWSTANNAVAVIDNNGRLTATGGGQTTITAEYYSNGKLYRKTKDIVVNFPDIKISQHYVAGEGYRFTAKNDEEDIQELLDGLIADGTLQYEWTLLDSEGNRTTKMSPSNVITYLPKEDDILTVIVRLVDTDGRKSKLRSTSFNLRTPMSINYRYVVVDEQHNIYFVNDSTYEVGIPLNNFMATYRFLPMNETDNINTVAFVHKYLKGTDCYISYPYGTGMKRYMEGVRIEFFYEWEFDFFDQALFLDELEDVIIKANGEERIMKEFSLTLCNSEQEPLQNIPFAIIYKPVFPEN